MSEILKPPVSQLPAELQKQLSFEYTPTGEWLFSDEMIEVAETKHGEFLPARVRVSRDGSRFEIGARVQDLEGLLELNRIVSPNVQTVDSVINFWKNNPRFNAKVEDDRVYIGTNIESTKRGLETDYSSVEYAYEVAIESAISGRSYDELAQDERYGVVLQDIKETRPSGWSILFDRDELEERKQALQKREENATYEIKHPITAKNLREYLLDTNDSSLVDIPGVMITWDGRTRDIRGAWIIAHNGGPKVDIFDSQSVYDSNNKKWNHERIGITLPIPEGIEIKTVNDLAKLHVAQIKLSNEESEESMELDVNVIVEDNSFRVVAQDPENPFNLEMRNYQCTDCELPYWKFRRPTSEEANEEADRSRTDFWMYNSVDWGRYCHIDTTEGEKLYCFDCTKKFESDYLEENPIVKKSTAVEIAKGKLTESGYPDVQISPRFSFSKGQGEWELFTYIEYERDGMSIIRHTGTPTLTDGGEFNLNMKPREYVDFRYQAV